jgi:hypothetical protein
MVRFALFTGRFSRLDEFLLATIGVIFVTIGARFAAIDAVLFVAKLPAANDLAPAPADRTDDRFMELVAAAGPAWLNRTAFA